MVQTYDHPTLGPIKYPPSPVKFAGWEMPTASAPMLGEHTRLILTDRLGLDDAAIDALLADRAVGAWLAPA